MPNLGDQPPPDNPKVDPLLAFVARAQARARLWFEAQISDDELFALIAERPDFVHPHEAGTIVRVAMRQDVRRRQAVIP